MSGNMPTAHEMATLLQKKSSHPIALKFVDLHRANNSEYLARGAAADVWKVTTPQALSGQHRIYVSKVLRVSPGCFQSIANETNFTTGSTNEPSWDTLVKAYRSKVLQWSALGHRNVIRVFDHHQSLNLHVEFCYYGSVREALRAPDGGGLDKWRIVLDVLDGLEYLHGQSPPVVHGNLNAGKIFIDSNYTTKIGEFGLAVLCLPIAPLASSIAFTGFSRWMSPELLNIDPDMDVGTTQSTSDDIWAMACTILEIFTGKVPFSKYSHDIRIQNAIISGELPGNRGDLPYDDTNSFDMLWTTLENCWLKTPSQRPDVMTLRNRVASALPLPVVPERLVMNEKQSEGKTMISQPNMSHRLLNLYKEVGGETTLAGEGVPLGLINSATNSSGTVNNPRFLDSTRLVTEPGHSPGTRVYHTQSNDPRVANAKAVPLSFRDAIRFGLPQVEAPSKDKVPNAPRAEPEWQVVRYGKKGRNPDSETGLVASSQSYQSSGGSFPLAQVPVSIKCNTSTSTGNRQLPTGGRLSVKRPSEASSSALSKESNDYSVATSCTSYEDSLPNNWINMKQEVLEIWWHILGFTRQRERLKQADFVKALAAMGFTVRYRDGAQVSYSPPPNFESTQRLTIHLPHRVDIAYTELKNKAKTINRQYPNTVNMLYQQYTAIKNGSTM